MIWIRVTVDPEEQEYTQDRMPVRYQAPYTHIHTLIPSQGQYGTAKYTYWHVFETWEETGETRKKNPHRHMENM